MSATVRLMLSPLYFPFLCFRDKCWNEKPSCAFQGNIMFIVKNDHPFKYFDLLVDLLLTQQFLVKWLLEVITDHFHFFD